MARSQRRARRPGHGTEEEVQKILRDAVGDELPRRTLLGSRLQARFGAIGLDCDLPELRAEVARPMAFEESSVTSARRRSGRGR